MRTRMLWFAAGALIAALFFLGIYNIPAVRYQAEWRLDAAAGVLRGWLYPGDTLPAPASPVGADLPPIDPSPTQPTATPGASPTPAPSPTPLPAAVSLPAPEWEKQDWNNCGPATLALGLRYYGWDGDQFTISDLLKPDRGDKNVNIDELAYFVRTRAGWLEAGYRVNGDIDLLKRFLAAGYPVIVEKGYVIESEGPDAGWAGHYVLLTGYDDQQGVFITQDTFLGANHTITYDALDEGWRAFNRAYLYFYPRQNAPDLASILGPDLDPDANRERALSRARAEAEANPADAYAWFNIGTNLLYFERYREAAQAYDQALALGLPWRFTRYQFGPYIAYFNQGRLDEVIALADATLKRTAKAEESLLWRGWAELRLGDAAAALEDFRAALRINPNYLDAQYALEYMGASP